MKYYIKSFSFLSIVVLLYGCSTSNSKLFNRLLPSQTNINFNNRITETDDFNILTNEYIFNGGGVAVADFNNDSLPDLFFTGNMVSNRIYINKGDLKFEDLTEPSNLFSKGFWSTGVTVADVNGDSLPDIYVCGAMYEENRANKLYIHQGLDESGNPFFKEEAEAYGVADKGNSMAAAFIDFDRDGDLDLYVLNNEQNETIPTNYRKKIIDGTAPSNDKLYENLGNGSFQDITLKAGISIEGFGLSVTPLDVNKDQWVDLFITNDYLTNDLLYINQKDGTFKNQIENTLLHQSKFSMGSDAADFNNDGYTDIVSLDMLGETHQRKKTTIAKSSFFQNTLNKKWGYQNQHMRNMLFKNNGGNYPFSEIGQYAGIYQTDWSWAPLFFDANYDGNKDLLITNGFPRDITDMDFANYKLNAGPFTPISIMLDSIPIVKIPNYAFSNTGNLKFEDTTEDWGLKIASFSNGAVVSDLDLDGDLDYVVNNINDSAFVFENTLLEQEITPNYIQLELRGSSQNIFALGAKVTLRISEDSLQYQEQQISRGYMSSVDPIMYFGLGSKDEVISIEVLWPNGELSVINNPEVNKRHTLRQSDSFKAETLDFPFIETNLKLAHQEVSSVYGIEYYHEEKNVQDFFNQRLLPNKVSQNGPPIAVGDLNGDHREDFIVGSAADYSPTVFIQTSENSFTHKPLFKLKQDMTFEEESLSLFDFDLDGDLDLYMVSGGNQFEENSNFYRDRILINDGKGNFKVKQEALPLLMSNGSVVRANDFDQDGDIDLFVGGRNAPKSYPLAAPSFLLVNNDGFFEIADESVFPAINDIGMVRDASWGDFNQDGKDDLVIVGDYTGIQVFLNQKEGFRSLENQVLKDATGLWRTTLLVDFDEDGDLDILLGNLGKNNMFNMTPLTPLLISTTDIDGNGSVDPLMFCSQLNSKGEWDMYPTQFWDNLGQQSPVYRKEFNSYTSFSNANLAYYRDNKIVSEESLLKAKYDASMWAENLGEGAFKLNELPELLQLGPINDFLVAEFDGKPAIYAVGNDFGGPPFEGNFDAFQGGIMTFGKEIKVYSPQESGFFAFGDARDLELLHLNGIQLILVSQNAGKLLAFEQK